MKSLIFLIISVLSLTVYSQNTKSNISEVEFTVYGSCNMCKERIENAALLKGVKLSSWDKDKQMLKVIYRTDKVSLEDIKIAVLNVGHDLEDKKASDEHYNSLHGCCKYRNNPTCE